MVWMRGLDERSRIDAWTKGLGEDLRSWIHVQTISDEESLRLEDERTCC